MHAYGRRPADRRAYRGATSGTWDHMFLKGRPDAEPPQPPHIAVWRLRITYWLTPSHTAVLLTVFRKTKMREESEVKRAKLAQRACEAEHSPAHEEFVRIIEKGEAEQ